MSAQIATRTMTNFNFKDFYKIKLLNDNYTTMELVLDLVQNVFDYDEDTAFEIVMEIHEYGHTTVIDNLTIEDATKLLDNCMDYAKSNGATHFKGIIEKQ